MTDVQISPPETQAKYPEVHAGCEQSERRGVALCGELMDKLKPHNADGPTCLVCAELIEAGKPGFTGLPPYPCTYKPELICSCWKLG